MIDTSPYSTAVELRCLTLNDDELSLTSSNLVIAQPSLEWGLNWLPRASYHLRPIELVV